MQKSTSTHIIAFQAQLYTVLNSMDNLGSYDIFYTVIYVTLIYLTEKGMYSATVIKELYFYLL